MRATLLPFLVLVGFAFSCAEDKPPGGDETDADTDADADTDTDADTDADTDTDDAGGDIASAKTIAYSDKKSPSASDSIGSAGDKDFFALDMSEGETVFAFTAAYLIDGEIGNPDTVIRILDANGDLLVENDDMPTRLQETDSAILFQAPSDDTYYVEILEWSDWDPTSEGPEGGSDWDYDFYAWPWSIEDKEPNDTTADADAFNDAKEPTYYTNFFGADYPSDFYGVLDSDTDVDTWRIDFDEPEFLAVILYPGYWDAPDLELTMYDAAGFVVAQTTDPEFDSDNIAFEDVALLHWAPAGTYYFSVRDLNGTVGTSYGGMLVLYLESNSDFEAENNDVVVAGNPVSFEESTTFPGYYFGTMTGAVGVAGDDVDCFAVNASDVGGTLDGMYLAARTQAMTVGTLVDTEITVYESDGTTVLANETESDLTGSADAGTTDLEIPDDQSVVYICVEAQSADSYAPANQYLLALEVSPEPVFE